MATHDQLTDAELALLDEVETGSLRISQDDLLFTERGKGLMFLCQAGFAVQNVEHISRNAGASIVSINRTMKPRPATS